MSRLDSAERLARAAIARYLPSGWAFGWVEDAPAEAGRGARARSARRGERSRRVNGMCDNAARTIRLSRAHALASPAEDVWTTILHEIAHARATSLTGRADHGPVWVAECHRLGIGEHADAYSARTGGR